MNMKRSDRNRKFRYIYILLLIGIFLFLNSDSFAQCALCKANAESDLKNGGTTAKGLNHGILYLMTIPYIILGTLFFIFFKKQILEKVRILKSKYTS